MPAQDARIVQCTSLHVMAEDATVVQFVFLFSVLRLSSHHLGEHRLQVLKWWATESSGGHELGEYECLSRIADPRSFFAAVDSGL